jgi:hypothetical protein
MLATDVDPAYSRVKATLVLARRAGQIRAVRFIECIFDLLLGEDVMTLGKWMARALASALVLGAVSIAGAANLAINFASDEPPGVGSAVNGPAGVFGTAV